MFSALAKRFGLNGRERPRVGVFFSPDYVAAAAVSVDGRELLMCAYAEASPLEQTRALSKMVDEHDLGGSPAYIVLSGSHYTVRILDAPGVPDPELPAALRFQLRGKTEEPMEQMMLAGQRLHQQRPGRESRLAQASLSQRVHVNQLIARVRACDLDPQGVYPRETVMHDLAVAMGKLRPGTDPLAGRLLLWMGAQECLMTISAGDQLCLARRHTPGSEQLRAADDVVRETLLREIRRNISYFRSELSNAGMGEVSILPFRGDRASLVAYCQENLGVNVTALDLRNLFPETRTRLDLDERTQAFAALALGAALPRASDRDVSFFQPRETRKDGKSPLALLVYSGLSLGLLMIGSVVMSTLLSQKQGTVQEAEKQRDELLARISAVEQLATSTSPSPELVDRKRQLDIEFALRREVSTQLQQLELAFTGGFSAQLAALTRNPPGDVWLSEIRLGGDGSGSMSGYALRPEAVHDFMDWLIDLPEFGDWVFDGYDVRQAQVADRNIASFSVYRLMIPSFLPGSPGALFGDLVPGDEPQGSSQPETGEAVGPAS